MLKKAKTIKELYEEVKNYDLVITNDAPLATALNKLVEKPRLDYFAMTPRQIGTKYASLHLNKIYTKAEIILEIVNKSKKSLKLIQQTVEKIFEIWNHSGLLESCILYLSKEESELLSYLEKFPSVEKAMEKFDEGFYRNKNICVVGLELFNELDKQILPKREQTVDKISLFKEGKFKIEKTYLFNSSNDLINQVVSLINKENQDDIAIVLNTESKYLDILKSKLKENDIKLQIKSYLSEDINTRNILSFIDFSFRVLDLKVKDITFLEFLFSVNINRYYNNFYFSNFIKMYNKDKFLRKIFEVMVDINSFTYKKFFDELKNNFRAEVNSGLIKVVEILNLLDKNINEENLNLINYFLKHIDVEISKSNEGILFVNALNSAFIGRPTIIFIGLDASWTKLSFEKQYINKVEEEKKNLEKFQILLSQGEHQCYLVKNLEDYLKVIPCYYFNILGDKNIKSFEDKYFNPVYINFKDNKFEFQPHTEKLRLKRFPSIDAISPSSLNRYFQCPKKYSFNTLTPSQEQSFFLKGRLLHNFAEFYFNHPEYVKKNFNKILDYLLDSYKGFIRNNLELERTSFLIGMKAVMNFLDNLQFEKIQMTLMGEKETNFLFTKTNQPKKFFNTERYTGRNESRIVGRIDLFSGNTIVDYKTSKTKTTGAKLLQEFNVERLEEKKIREVNFQTVAYLANKREEIQNTIIDFIYCFLVADIKEIINEKALERPSIITAKYIPITFKEYILSEEGFEKINNTLLEKIGYENYRDVLESNFDSIDFYDCNSIIENLEDLFFDLAINEMELSVREFRKLNFETFRRDIIQALCKSIFNIRIGKQGDALIFKDDINEFLKIVHEKISEINESYNTNFQNKPIFDLRSVCNDCDYLNICIGNKLWSGKTGE